MKEVMVNEVKCLFPEENGSNSRRVQKSIQKIFAPVNDKLAKAVIIDENDQVKGWLNVAPLGLRNREIEKSWYHHAIGKMSNSVRCLTRE